MRDLNRLYRDIPALHARDCEAEGFEWLVVDDAEQSVVAFLRHDGAGGPMVAAIFNFTPVARENYWIGLPRPGRWREILNTDAPAYGGSGLGNLGAVTAAAPGHRGFPAAAEVTAPPLAAVYLLFDPD